MHVAPLTVEDSAIFRRMSPQNEAQHRVSDTLGVLGAIAHLRVHGSIVEGVACQEREARELERRGIV